MIATAIPHTNWGLNYAVLVGCRQVCGKVNSMFSSESSKKQRKYNKQLSPKERFDAYLEGYEMSFDLFPVCHKPLFATNDLHALLRDFWEIGTDVSRGTNKLIDKPFSDQKSAVLNDTREKRIAAARKAIEAIQRANSKRAD